MSYSKTIVMGHLGQDPELRYTPSGTPVCNCTMATTDRWTDKQGQKQEQTEWHRLVVWGKRGEAADEYWKKGMMIHVEGQNETQQWDDRDGNKRFTTKVKVHSWEFCGSKADNQGSNSAPSGPGQDPARSCEPEMRAMTADDLPEDQLPF